MARRRNVSGKQAGSGVTSKRPRPTLTLDETIESSSDEENFDETKLDNSPVTDSDDDDENVETKRVRMARDFLNKIDEGQASSSDESDDDDDEASSSSAHVDRTSRKLQELRRRQEGTLETDVALQVGQEISSKHTSMQAWMDAGDLQLLRGHDLPPTCVTLTHDGTRAYSGSKDHSIISWNVETGQKEQQICKHWKKQKQKDVDRTLGQVLSMACSDDGRYLAVGARDATVRIFDVRTANANLIHTFTGHKDAVTCLTFRRNSLQLFSGSADRCLRHYNLQQDMLYIETLYGHQFGVTDVACHHKERPVSVGGQDRTARAWKLAEDSHLIFRGGATLPYAESVTTPRDDWFVTGHSNGHVCLWKTDKKRAVATVAAAHTDESHGIVCCRSLPGSDLVVTGSNDGYLRLFQARMGSTLAERGLEIVGQIPLEGYINDVALGPEARFAVAAIGQEHRMGRWDRITKAKNRIAIVQLRHGSTDHNDDADDNNDNHPMEEIDEPPAEEDSSSSDGSNSS